MTQKTQTYFSKEGLGSYYTERLFFLSLNWLLSAAVYHSDILHNIHINLLQLKNCLQCIIYKITRLISEPA